MVGTPALLALGSNLGDRQGTLERAVQSLRRTDGIQVRQVSRFIETAPIGPVQDQPAFLNGVVSIETTLLPLDLLSALKSIEVFLGRQSRKRWGPREIDLDILTYGDLQMSHPLLKIPHPEIDNRSFLRSLMDEVRAPSLSHSA